MYLTMGEWANACNGRILTGTSDLPVGGDGPGGLSIDTRKISAGQWFIALIGKEGRDGHNHLADAVAKDVGGLVVSDVRKYESSVRKYNPDLPTILVPDTVESLADAARALLDKFSPFVIAITGTVGKTSVKESVAHIASLLFPVLKNPHNWNTEIGLPLTVFELNPQHKVAVLECASRGIGQIRQLSLIARPDIAVITAIGPGHLSEFGSIDAVARAKWEIIDGLRPDGIVIAPGNSPYTKQFGAGLNPVTFGMDETCDVYPSNIEFDQFETRCEIHTPAGAASISIPSTGSGDLMNTLCAIACCINIKTSDGQTLSLDEIANAVGSIPQIPGRHEKIFRQSGIEVIFDAYNSNPLSLHNALESLARRSVLSDGTPIGRRVAILGDMLELGADEEIYHIEAGKLAGSLPIDMLITVGPLASLIRESAEDSRNERIPGGHFESTHECASALPDLLNPCDLVLMKASRALAFEILLEGDW